MSTFGGTLSHHGIKGMKWGVRRSEAELARARGESPKTSTKKSAKSGGIFQKKAKSSKPVATSKPKAKNISEMSDEELKKFVDRLRLEDDYRKLTPKQESRGKQFVDELLLKPAMTAGGKVMSDYMEQKLRDILGVQKKKK